MQFLASYTFTRDLANVYGSTIGANGGTTVGDNNNLRADYGPDSFIRPHRFVFSAVYELPGPKDRHSLAGELLEAGNWRVSPPSSPDISSPCSITPLRMPTASPAILRKSSPGAP